MWDVTGEVLWVSLPSMGERLIMSLALLTYFKILSAYGTAAIAAYAIGVRLLSFSWAPGLGFAAAASTFVGQALGASDSSARARRAGARSRRPSSVTPRRRGAVRLLARAHSRTRSRRTRASRENLMPFMLMLAIAQPFMGAHFTLGGVLRGAGDTLTPLVGAAVGNWGFRVPLAWLFTRCSATTSCGSGRRSSAIMSRACSSTASSSCAANGRCASARPSAFAAPSAAEKDHDMDPRGRVLIVAGSDSGAAPASRPT